MPFLVFFRLNTDKGRLFPSNSSKSPTQSSKERFCFQYFTLRHRQRRSCPCATSIGCILRTLRLCTGWLNFVPGLRMRLIPFRH
nr:MAG TPA: hypothetical protein [Caudoviricetes sp.]